LSTKKWKKVIKFFFYLWRPSPSLPPSWNFNQQGVFASVLAHGATRKGSPENLSQYCELALTEGASINFFSLTLSL